MDGSIAAERVAVGVALNGYFHLFDEHGLTSEQFSDLNLKSIIKVYEEKPSATQMLVHQKTKIDLASISKLIDEGFSVELLPEAAETIIDLWKTRTIKAVCKEISDGHKSVEEGVVELQQADSYGAAKVEKPTDQWASYTDTLERIYNSGGEQPGIATGIASLDRAYFHLAPKTVHVIAARPGGGKTALALQIAINVSTNDRAHFFSYEMSRQRLMDRITGNLAKVNMQMFKANPSDTLAAKITSAMAKNSKTMNRLSIDECYGWDFPKLKRQAIILAKQGVKLFILDYLQIMRAPRGRYHSRAEEVAKLSGAIAELARVTGTVFIVLVQANRELDKRAPFMSDLKESGAIEADADTVAFLVPAEEPGITQHHLLKNRDGFTGITRLIFNKSTQQFSEEDNTERTR